MKKFLCYDTNDAASGKINVDSRGMLKPNSTVPSTNGASYQQLVTDSDGNTKWEDRLAYEGSRLVIDGRDAQFVKVSDEVPSWATLGASMKVWKNFKDGGIEIDEVINAEDSTPIGDGSFFNNAGIFAMIDNLEFDTLVLQEKGVYFFSTPVFYISGISSADSDTPEITWDGNIGIIKTIDPKYIPADHINSLIDAKLGVIENGSY